MAIVVASLSLHAALASGPRSCSVSSSPSLRRSAPLLVQTNPEFWQPHDDEKHPNEAPGTGQPRVEAVSKSVTVVESRGPAYVRTLRAHAHGLCKFNPVAVISPRQKLIRDASSRICPRSETLPSRRASASSACPPPRPR